MNKRIPGNGVIRANITLESNIATSSVAGLIARVLMDAGATIKMSDRRISVPMGKAPNLKGLEVNFCRIIWIR